LVRWFLLILAAVPTIAAVGWAALGTWAMALEVFEHAIALKDDWDVEYNRDHLGHWVRLVGFIASCVAFIYLEHLGIVAILS
jgi:hypothetical protein